MFGSCGGGAVYAVLVTVTGVGALVLAAAACPRTGT